MGPPTPQSQIKSQSVNIPIRRNTTWYLRGSWISLCRVQNLWNMTRLAQRAAPPATRNLYKWKRSLMNPTSAYGMDVCRPSMNWRTSCSILRVHTLKRENWTTLHVCGSPARGIESPSMHDTSFSSTCESILVKSLTSARWVITVIVWAFWICSLWFLLIALQTIWITSFDITWKVFVISLDHKLEFWVGLNFAIILHVLCTFNTTT